MREMKMEIIRSNKGNDKVCLNGHTYTFHKTCATVIRWRCSKYGSKMCRALLTTTLGKTNTQVMAAHNHSPDSEKVKAIIAVDKMKNVARGSSMDPSQIFAQGVRSLSNATRAKLPLEESLKRTLRNQREIDAPKNPESLQNFVIEGDWKTTGETEEHRFLLDDNGPRADERIIIFATDQLLQLLDAAKEWWMDGTFEVAPSLFMQLYVLRVRVSNSFVTVAYCLLERKTTRTYKEMLQTLMDRCRDREIYPDPEVIHVDFEEAVMGAVKSVLGDEVRVQGCFYHLTQNTYRKVQKLGVQAEYLENEELNRFCGMLDGLTFLPEDDVEKGMNYLREPPPPMGEKGMELVNYFDTTYVSGGTRQVSRRKVGSTVAKVRRIAPQFPKALWNVNQVTKEDGHRTDNQTEGRNNRFRHIVDLAHPTIWLLIEKMRDEQASDATKLVQRNAGVIQRKKKRADVVDRQLKLKNICIVYDQKEHTIESFLTAISETIRSRSHWNELYAC